MAKSSKTKTKKPRPKGCSVCRAICGIPGCRICKRFKVCNKCFTKAGAEPIQILSPREDSEDYRRAGLGTIKTAADLRNRVIEKLMPNDVTIFPSVIFTDGKKSYLGQVRFEITLVPEDDTV